MAAGDDWSRVEVEAAVADYLDMLTAELVGLPYSKAEHNRQLQRLIPDRTKGSIEFKHQNISAALLELGYAYIEGYKPARNYQELLEEVVAQQLAGNTALEAAIRTVVNAEVVAAQSMNSLLDMLTDPPKSEDRVLQVRERRKAKPRLVTNWLEIETLKRSIGDAGELKVLAYEAERLTKEGQSRLAERIEHVSRTKGDGLGYDIHSFDASGKDRLIEVKTTKFGLYTPFFASRNEVEASADLHEHYQLYRLFSFAKSPRLYTLKGSLQSTCLLEPMGFQARVL